MADTSIDKVYATEIEGYIFNTQKMYNQLESIQKNLVNKIASGKYDAKLAPKLFMYLIEAGCKGYAKENQIRQTGYVLNVATRKYLAVQLAEDFYKEALTGEYEHLLAKKYQKKSK